MRSLLVALALLAAGCPAGLEPQTSVSKLRVLAIRADPPELILQLDAGLPAATLTALAVDPSDAGISMHFALCTELSGVPSPTLPCPGAAGIDLPGAGPLAARLDLADPRILAFAAAAQLDGGAFDAGGFAQALDQGVPLLIGFTASTDARSLSGFQTLTLRTGARGPANSNPHLLDLEIPDAGPGETVHLQPDAGAKDDASEHYLFSFFATDGGLAALHTTDTTSTGQAEPTWVEWTAPKLPGPVRIWVVVRDGRGGVDWLERDVEVPK
ncbi:MAG: hypothetical protein ACXWLM_05395 [Myxococcales bacterium]